MMKSEGEEDSGYVKMKIWWETNTVVARMS